MAIKDALGRFALGYASSGDPAFAKLATQVSTYRNAEFIRDLNSKTLQLRLSQPGISDMAIQNFESQAHAQRVSRATGIESLSPVPQSRFQQEQTYKEEQSIREESNIRQDKARNEGYAKRYSAQAKASTQRKKQTEAETQQETLTDVKGYQEAYLNTLDDGTDPFEARTRLQESIPEIYDRVMRPFFRRSQREAGSDKDKLKQLWKDWPAFRKGSDPNKKSTLGVMG